MIDIVYHSENAFIYDVDDWEKLRKEFRLVGQLFGHNKHKSVLPLLLLPEEALLLIEKGIGRLVSYTEEQTTNDELEAFKKRLFEVETEYYKELRLKQLQQNIHKIMAGKRKKGDMRSEKEIIDGELSKLVINEKKLVWPIFKHKFDKNSAKLLDKDLLWKFTTLIKYETFKNFWERKFYITSGANFGGDFLVYPGDPIFYHSNYIVRCLNENETVYPTELVVLGRVATTVRKKGVISYLQDGKVNYITIKWFGK
ncbi:tRNA-splicing endonuclease subunit Sen34 [Atheta coriaria]|uniref:tRNA-splicing endonuclease subunit Sen34 n=1 Tax=Dalotia coriaria TaxID=877792 RepID=UPI0031F3C557